MAKLLPFILAQTLGGFIGAAIVFGDYKTSILRYSDNKYLVYPH